MKRKYQIGSLILAFITLALLFAPEPDFKRPYSTVVLAENGQLLGARISNDGQWRFPSGDTVPDKFKTCLLLFEDRYYNFHPGVNPVSICRAIFQNLKAKKIVSGGSTLTMQVARLSGSGKKRTICNKALEILSAIKMELIYSKKSILSFYASNAPFGGNVVGIEAACWRYFGHNAQHLSWSEAATLAVLPNAPSLIFPGNNDQKLKIKRDNLLGLLLKKKIIDHLAYDLSISEPLPSKPYALPDYAYHLTDRLNKFNPGQRINTTIDFSLQNRVSDLVAEHSSQFAAQHIFNAAALIIDVKKNQIRAYIGNSSNHDPLAHNNQVDMITSPRSTGSILKPFLYASMLSDGKMLPDALLPDIPVYLSGYAPKNFDNTFHGAVPASQALSWSLNIPAIYMLKSYGIDRLMDKLKKFGFTTFKNSSDHYGLSIILGGGETSLLELCSAYAGFSRTLNNFNTSHKYFKQNFSPPTPVKSTQKDELTQEETPVDAGAIWFTLQALLKVNRPDSEAGWEYFQSSKHVAWKTGTSFGFRDAWAIATTPDYIVGVWAGNSNGEGRPGLTGITAAAPLLFNILNLLPDSPPHEEPGGETTYAEVCSQSGYRRGSNCREGKMVVVPVKGLRTDPCPFCQSIKTLQPSSGEKKENIFDQVRVEKWFILPPAMEFYFKKYHPAHLLLPANMINNEKDFQKMEFIYPGTNDRIYIPRTVEGKTGKVLFEVAHRESDVEIFWHLDQQYVGKTKYIHQMPLNPSPGRHLITLTDEHGNTLRRSFTILNPKNAY